MKTVSLVLRSAQIASFAALAALAVGLAAPAHSAEKSVIVRFAELDLNKQAGVEVLYKRIKRAAFQVCDPEFGPITAFQTRKGECYRNAVANAVAKVNSPLLTALHTGSPERVASR